MTGIGPKSDWQKKYDANYISLDDAETFKVTEQNLIKTIIEHVPQLEFN